MIIGLGHISQSGKDTVADYLSNYLPNTKIVSLAWPVKETALSLFSYLGLQPTKFYENNPQYKDIKLPLVNIKPRDIWIKIGQEMREIDEDVWLRKIRGLDTQDQFLIIPDVRNPNEADYIKANGGMVFNVDRGLIPNNILDLKLINYHFDYTIRNYGTLEDLETEVKNLIPSINAHFGLAVQ